jgi:ABC-2 type transport system permease protein
VGAVRALTLGLGNDTEALLGHTTSWFVVRSLLWSAAILVVFAALSTRRFTRS